MREWAEEAAPIQSAARQAPDDDDDQQIQVALGARPSLHLRAEGHEGVPEARVQHLAELFQLLLEGGIHEAIIPWMSDFSCQGPRRASPSLKGCHRMKPSPLCCIRDS